MNQISMSQNQSYTNIKSKAVVPDAHANPQTPLQYQASPQQRDLKPGVSP